MQFLILIAAIALGRSAEPAAESTLQQAYQNELIYLEGQLRSLEKQVERQRQASEKELAELKSNRTQLETSFTEIKNNKDRLSRRLTKLENQTENEGSQALQAKISNAQLFLSDLYEGYPRKIQFDQSAPLEKQAADVLKKALESIELFSSAVTYQQEYFGLDGSKSKGNVIWYGRNFVTNDRGEALAPLGRGRFQVTSNWAETIIEPSTTRSKPALVFNRPNLPLKIPKEKNLSTFMEAAGPIGWIIVALGGLAVIALIARALNIQKNKFVWETDVSKVISSQYPTVDAKENAISELLVGISLQADRLGSLVGVIAAIAPLLGLLGTVTGMIATFDIITTVGTGDPSVLSGGISEALVTTMLGLIVAIPTLFFGQIITGWADNIKSTLEELAFSTPVGDA